MSDEFELINPNSDDQEKLAAFLRFKVGCGATVDRGVVVHELEGIGCEYTEENVDRILQIAHS